jgi:hypothetical protein
MRRPIVILPPLAAIAAGCAAEIGPRGLDARATFLEPAPVGATREVAAFERLRVEGRLDVIVRVGLDPALRVRGDEGRLAEITSEVRDGTLILGAVPGQPWRDGPRAEVDVPSLAALDAAGGGWVVVRGIDAGPLSVRLTGTGDVRVTGEFRSVEVADEGVGRIEIDAAPAR